MLYSVVNKTCNYCCYCYCYYVYDRGCWHMYIDTTPGSVPSRASSSSCLLAEGQTLPYLDWSAILHSFAQFTSLLRQMQLGNSHDLLHMLNSRCKTLSSAVASAVHMITRSLKEHTGFTEIPGRLGKAHLLGQIMLFLKALMVLPLMDSTMNASNNFYGIVYQIWFHWIHCFYPWKKNTFPSKKHPGLIYILQLSENPVIFLSSVTPGTCPVAVTLDFT